MQQSILKLKGTIQHYAWGGDHFIPDLLGIDNDNPPYAEYWMGAHSGSSATVEWDGQIQPLNQLIRQEPGLFLGNYVSERFGELPYLFKVLDVKQMLSIQVHPSREAAVQAFELEEKAGIPLNAPNRNYKDRNHKPEIMIALSEFWLLHGFRKRNSLVKILDETEAFRFLGQIFQQKGYSGLYEHVMELPQEEVDKILQPLVRSILAAPRADRLQPAYWVRKLYEGANTLTGLDRGIFSIYFFNIVHLFPGQGIFQAAGVPHAYLEGQNMELMANSDNVLRGGLTPKHIDVPELMKHIIFDQTRPVVLDGQPLESFETGYPCPVPDFGITAISLQPHQQFESQALSGEIFFVYKGAVQVDGQNESFKRGESFYAMPGARIVLKSHSDTLVYRAFVPSEQ